VFPRRQRQAGLRLVIVIAAEACGKPPAFGGVRGGGSSGRSRSWRLFAQPLLARQIGLLRALLALQQAVLRRQQALLLALRPSAFRLLRLQLLYALLQAIDAALALPGLTGKYLALPLLHDLLALRDMLFALLRALLL